MPLYINLFGPENIKFMVLALIVLAILLWLLLLGIHYLDKNKGRVEDSNSKISKNSLIIAAILLALYALMMGINLFKSGNLADSGTARLVAVMPIFIFAALIIAAYYGMKPPTRMARVNKNNTGLLLNPQTNEYSIVASELDTAEFDAAFDKTLQDINQFKTQNVEALASLNEYKNLVRNYNTELANIIPKQLIDRLNGSGIKIPLVCNLVCSPESVRNHAQQIIDTISSYFDTTTFQIEKLKEQLAQCTGETTRLTASIQTLTVEKNGYENILKTFDANLKLLSTTSPLVASVFSPIFSAIESKLNIFSRLVY